MTERSESASAALEAIQRLSPTSGALKGNEVMEVNRLVEASKLAMSDAARALVESAMGAPLLSMKSADGTPLRIARSSRSSQPSGSTIVRSGHEGAEVLVKNQFLRGILQGCV